MDKVSASRLKNIIDICNSYKNGTYEITELQSRLETALLPEPETGIGRGLGELIGIATNQLDIAVIYSDDEIANEIADKIIQLVDSYLIS